MIFQMVTLVWPMTLFSLTCLDGALAKFPEACCLAFEVADFGEEFDI
jgi:hypothetical protein